MQFSNEAKKHILIVTAGTFVLGCAMLGVFALIGRFNAAVLLGAAIGCLLTSFNFWLMSRFLLRAVASGERGKGIIASSYTMRTLMMLVGGALSIALLKVNPFALLIPYAFPRLMILFMQITGIYKPKDADKEAKP